MLSFEEPSQRDAALSIAYVNGPNFRPNTPLFLYENPNPSDSHFDNSFNSSLLEAEEHKGLIRSRVNDRLTTVGPAIPLPMPGKAIQLYGLNKFSLSAATHPKQVKTILLCAAPGSGKSYFIGKYMDNYRRMYPESKIIVFSRKSSEPEFREDYQQIDVESKEFLQNPISVNDCVAHREKGILAVFDDTSTFSREVVRAVHATMNDLIKVGRSSNIHVIMSNHVINGGVDTTAMHNNATATVLFPNSHREKVEDYFKKRLKLKTDAVDFLMEQPTRWILVQHSTPQYILTENQAFLLNALTDYVKKQKKKSK